MTALAAIGALDLALLIAACAAIDAGRYVLAAAAIWSLAIVPALVMRLGL